MVEDLTNIRIRDDEEQHRFIAETGGTGDEAFIEYVQRGDKIVFAHTEFAPRLKVEAWRKNGARRS